MVVLGAQVQTKLYKISGCGYDYTLCEYDCPELEENFNIEIPEIISNTYIDGDKFEELCDIGIINKKVEQFIADGHWKATYYFVATKQDNEDKWICNQLKCIDNHLIGRLPKKIDMYKFSILMGIWGIICIILFCLFAERFLP